MKKIDEFKLYSKGKLERVEKNIDKAIIIYKNNDDEWINVVGQTSLPFLLESKEIIQKEFDKNIPVDLNMDLEEMADNIMAKILEEAKKQGGFFI